MTVRLVLTNGHDQAQATLIGALERRGLEVVRGFDLRSACRPTAGGRCPHSGPAGCRCQYVILLVYSRAALQPGCPATITLHSQAEVTRIEVVQDANTPADPALVAVSLAVLTELSAAGPVERADAR